MRDGRIETNADILDARCGELVIDDDSLWLLPGVIDDQLHFANPASSTGRTLA